MVVGGQIERIFHSPGRGMIMNDDSNSLMCRLEDDSRVVVVGLGGIGGALLQPLALFLHSYGISVRLVLVDGDEFEPKNAERQSLPVARKQSGSQSCRDGQVIGG